MTECGQLPSNRETRSGTEYSRSGSHPNMQFACLISCRGLRRLYVQMPSYIQVYHGSVRITPSNATKAMAFAGNALRKQGTNPRQ